MAENRGRYVVYGYVAEEHEPGNPEFEPRSSVDQHRAGAAVIYDTDDRWEAKRIVNIEGGFIRDEKWFVAVGALDTQEGGIIGFVPEESDAR